MTVYTGYRNGWIFVQRIRRGLKKEESLAFLRHIAAHDPDPRGKKQAQRYLLQVEPTQEAHLG